jgi:hypothetical protein
MWLRVIQRQKNKQTQMTQKPQIEEGVLLLEHK